MACLLICTLVHSLLATARALRDFHLEEGVADTGTLDSTGLNSAAAAGRSAGAGTGTGTGFGSINDTSKSQSQSQSQSLSHLSESQSASGAGSDWEWLRDCNERQFTRATEFYGADKQTYSLRFKDHCGFAYYDTIATAFRNREQADSAKAVLDMLESDQIDFIAGLHRPGTFASNCVHVDSQAACCSGWNSHDSCLFLVTETGGSQTLEHCLSGYRSLATYGLRALIARAVDIALQLHMRGWSHGNFQLQSLRSDYSCASFKVKVTNLLGMKKSEWGSGQEMFNDLAMLFGLCDLGSKSQNIATLTKSNAAYDPNLNAMAAKISETAEAVLGEHCGSNKLKQHEVVDLESKLLVKIASLEVQ